MIRQNRFKIITLVGALTVAYAPTPGEESTCNAQDRSHASDDCDSSGIPNEFPFNADMNGEIYKVHLNHTKCIPGMSSETNNRDGILFNGSRIDENWIDEPDDGYSPFIDFLLFFIHCLADWTICSNFCGWFRSNDPISPDEATDDGHRNPNPLPERGGPWL